MTYNGKPLFYMDIDDETGLDLISLVEFPAVEMNFIAFNAEGENVRMAVNKEKKIVTGVALIPEQKIYRYSQERGEYYVSFSKEAIERIAVRFFKDHNSTNANLEHSEDVDGVVYFESYLVNNDRGIKPQEFDVPDGTWIVSAKIENEDLWKDIQEGKYKGFSIEGFLKMFDTKPVEIDTLEDLMEWINTQN